LSLNSFRNGGNDPNYEQNIKRLMMELQTVTQFLPPFLGGFAAASLLVLRLIWGSAMMLHGLPKIKNPRHWMEAEKLPRYPDILQILGALSTFLGGIAIIAGFLTPLAAFGLAGAMGVALFIHVTVFHSTFVKYPFDAPGGTYEPAIMYLAIAIVFLFVGPGRLSLDYLLFGQ
jgi:putative oxidoreductase